MEVCHSHLCRLLVLETVQFLESVFGALFRCVGVLQRCLMGGDGGG